jgi:hypothetical protein
MSQRIESKAIATQVVRRVVRFPVMADTNANLTKALPPP